MKIAIKRDGSELGNEPYLLSAAKTAEHIKRHRITAVQVAKSCIDVIKRMDGVIKAWAYFNEEKVMVQAEAIDEKIKRGQETGPLCGALVGIKDVFNTIDMPTEMGSPLWKGFMPGNDARSVTYVRWADGVIAGKTVTAEFAVHHPGPTVNPHNIAHAPGTSSSGSAAAVASYMVPLAFGTQTAGSTIRPASYCGVYGFKPSFGLIPRTGILKTLDTLDHVSLFARTLEDIKLLFDVLRIRGANYPFVRKFMDEPLRNAKTPKGQWKIAFVKTSTWGDAEGYARDSLLGYIGKIAKDKNVIIEEVNLPKEFDSSHDLHELIYSKAISYYFKEEYVAAPEKLSRILREMIESGQKINTVEYVAGLEKQNSLIALLGTFFNSYDIVITLSAAGEAPRGLYTKDKRDSCLIWTLCHVPAINLPLFRGPNGLPFGAQLVSKRYGDYGLLDFVRYLESKKLIGD